MLMLHDLKENSRSPSTGKATHTTCQTDWPKQLPATCVGYWHLDIQIAGCNMMQLHCATQSRGIHRSHIPNHDAKIMFANGQEKYLSANHQNNSYSDDPWTKLHFCHRIANDIVLSWRLSGSPYASYTFYLHFIFVIHVSIAPEAWSTSVQPGAPHPIHQCVFFPFSRIFGCPMIYEKKSTNVSCYSSTKNPWCHDLKSQILPASTIQRWAFRADPAMGYHGRYHEISLDVDALIWNDLNRKKMRRVEHLEPWLQSLHFCSNNHSPKIYVRNMTERCFRASSLVPARSSKRSVLHS